MVKAVVSPDKFRGSLDAVAATDAIAAGLARAGIDSVARVPMADGGDGTLDVLAAVLGGSWRAETVTGPLGQSVRAEWLMLPGGTGAIEMARASGLALVRGQNDPLRASTRGTGELIDAARRAGCKQLVVAVGGSATTDGGLGAIDALHWTLGGIDVTIGCDVQTRFVDAAEVYGPQKGATAAQIGLLRRRLELLADQYEARTGVNVRELDGGGAAGGLAGGLAALGAHIEAGFDVVANAVRLDERLEGSDIVVTGEGRLDAPSLEGKVVGGVLDAAAAAGVEHRVVICGIAERATRERLVADGVRTSHSTTSRAPFSPPASSIASIAPSPPSVVALPPAATSTTCAPVSTAATISSPVPRDEAASASRSPSARCASPLASATSTIAVAPSSISPNPACSGRPSGSLTSAPPVSPPSVVSNAASVPSPPSARGHRSGGGKPARSRPRPIAAAIAGAAKVPLKESGATRIWRI